MKTSKLQCRSLGHLWLTKLKGNNHITACVRCGKPATDPMRKPDPKTRSNRAKRKINPYDV